MSEEATRVRPYPGVIKEELAELNLKLDSLIKHWADAAEMTTIMEACRQTVHEAHQANHEALMDVHRQLGLLLTPVEIEAPTRTRLLLWAALVLGRSAPQLLVGRGARRTDRGGAAAARLSG